MKANISFSKGESTKANIERLVQNYLDQNERPVSIKEIRDYYLERNNQEVERMTYSAFEKMAQKQVLEHSMKFI